MERMPKVNVQKFLDGFIDKVFLRFIPKSVKPNYVTAVRFMLVPIVYWLLVQKKIDLALLVFVIAACTDFIDGAMARTRDQITDAGKIIDPIADKLLIISVLLYIGVKFFIVRVFIVFIVLELVAVLLGSWFSFVIGKPMGANVFGKLKLILQSISVGLFLLGELITSVLLIKISGYLLFLALFLAVVAGLETVRRKALYLKENKIIYSQPKS